MKKDIKYIIKRILIGVGIILVMSLINSCEVHAESISFEDRNGIIYYNPAGADINNTRQNTLYYHGGGYNPASFYAPLELLSTADYPAVFNGQYLIDFYIYGVGTFYQNYNCSEFSSNFRYIDLNSGSWVSASSKIKSQCIAVNKTKYNGYDSIHLLYKFTLNTDNNIGATEFSVQITKYNFFTEIATGTNIGYAIGNLYDYDVAIVDGFKNGAKLEDISNSINNQTQQQHQDSINEQNAINGINDSINDSSIPSDSSNQINAITSAITSNQNSSIVQIATFFPQTLQLILNGFNTSCTGGYSLGSLYGTELTIPCINPVDYLGSFLWGVIDSILCLCYLIPLCKFLVNKYNDLTSMKNLRWQ